MDLKLVYGVARMAAYGRAFQVVECLVVPGVGSCTRTVRCTNSPTARSCAKRHGSGENVEQGTEHFVGSLYDFGACRIEQVGLGRAHQRRRRVLRVGVCERLRIRAQPLSGRRDRSLAAGDRGQGAVRGIAAANAGHGLLIGGRLQTFRNFFALT